MNPGRLAVISTVLLAVSVLVFTPVKASAASSSGEGSSAAPLKGRLVFHGKGVPGGKVFLSSSYPPLQGEKIYEFRTDAEGYFEAAAPPGRYYVYATGRDEKGKPIFAFSGQNPVEVGRKERFLGLKAVAVSRPKIQKGEEDVAALSGRVTFEGKPVEGAYVYLYTDSGTSYKGLGFAISPPTDRQGRFGIYDLLETQYVIVARKRKSGKKTGPLEEGDLYCFYPGNPVNLFEGKELVVDIPCVEKEKDVPYSVVTSGSSISISGYVVDRMGNPVKGVYAFVYDTRVFGHKRPYSHSGKTGEGGKFTINIDKPGTYYLGARENFGYTPRPGELFGFYSGTPDHSIRLKEGERREGIVIVVDRVLGNGETAREPIVQKRVYDRGMPVRAIEKDTVLSGTVVVEGVLVVPKGVTVTISPGTVVKFKRIDVDGDGIGDGEFYVEGGVIVKGTKERPVIFTSAEENPSPKDWKYFFINMAERAQIEWLISEYAFSGVQIHFTKATVRNSVFRHNIDGLRFSTVRGVFESNLMVDNVYGVRYEERATEAVLRRNRITGNRVGIFAVTECRGGLKIVENDIYGNERYDFKLGNRQKEDVPAGGNFWGTSNLTEVEEMIFDGLDAEGLGRVLVKPLATRPFIPQLKTIEGK